jgi:integrase
MSLSYISSPPAATATRWCSRTPTARRSPPNAVRVRATKAWAAAKLVGIGFHEARHSFASHLIDSSINAKAITAYMGHSSITVTFERYGHLMPGGEADAVALLDAYHDRADS